VVGREKEERRRERKGRRSIVLFSRGLPRTFYSLPLVRRKEKEGKRLLGPKNERHPSIVFIQLREEERREKGKKGGEKGRPMPQKAMHGREGGERRGFVPRNRILLNLSRVPSSLLRRQKGRKG